jgi:hypothetical protein
MLLLPTLKKEAVGEEDWGCFLGEEECMKENKT